MKLKAILYTRVSTDEQNNGYSPADQKERLIKYCDQNNIEIVGFYHDDESGKSFNRPKWLEIMSFLKKNRGVVDLLLFIKWDRFSRNVAEAYITINALQKYGVEPQAIEQPLNFEIPEQKIMLAIYLAAPEVDNDRRALNIFHGIRRGKKEGRWLGARLKGYKNVRDENNKPIIVPEGGSQEALINKAFTEFASGMYNIEELRRKLNKEGLKATRNSFWMLLRNKGYIGKVFVPAYKDEPAQWVEGLHKAIIDEQTFYEVQDILDGRKKKMPNKYSAVRDELPLRGYLSCPQCGRNLTGSASRGRLGGKFFYYHCSNGCKERQRAQDMNKEFLKVLHRFNAQGTILELGAKVFTKQIKAENKQSKSELERITKELEKNRMRIKNAQVLMLDGELDPTEYKEMKIKLTEEIEKLGAEETKIRQGSNQYDKKVEDMLSLLQMADTLFDKGETVVKQRVMGSIFPEKLSFKNGKYRTQRLNEGAMEIFRNSGVFNGTKEEKQVISDLLSLEVESTDKKPNLLFKEIELLASLHHVLNPS